MYLVTGTSSGIGQEIALYLLSKDQKVVGVARRQSVIDHPNYTHIQGDICDPKLHTKLAEFEFQGVVFNHGILEPVAKLADAQVEDWAKCFEVNVFSIVGATKALLPNLRKSKARIIFVSSGAASGHYPTWGAYGATKAALNHFSCTLAAEEPDLCPIAVAPGVVDTQMQQNIRTTHAETMGDGVQKFRDLHSSGSLVSPKDSGKLYGNLVMSASPELRGKVLRYSDEELKSYAS